MGADQSTRTPQWDPTTVHVALTLTPHEQRRVAERLAAAGMTPHFVPRVDALKRALPDCTLLLTGRPPRLDWSAARRLRLLHVAGAGVDPLLPAPTLPESVCVTSSRGAHAAAVAEHALALLLAFARDLPRTLQQQATKAWIPFASTPLEGQALTIVGLGEIGRRVARASAALGLQVTGVCRRPRAVPDVAPVHPADALLASLRGADHVIVCVPLTARTRGLFGKAAFDALPRGAVVINVARGGVFDERALEAALRAGRLRGAALDVFEDEPLSPSSTLWTCPHLLITPHVGGLTPDYVDRVLDTFVANARRVLAGQPPLTPVSREHEY